MNEKKSEKNASFLFADFAAFEVHVHVGALTPRSETFTLPNARRFYSSMEGSFRGQWVKSDKTM